MKSGTASSEPDRPTFRSQTGWLLVMFILLLAIVSTLTGCGGGTEIETLLSSGPTVFDTEAHSAKIVAVSSLPIVCVVAYGPNTDYGLTTTDTNMAIEGGAHTEHRQRFQILFLEGLESLATPNSSGVPAGTTAHSAESSGSGCLGARLLSSWSFI